MIKRLFRWYAMTWVWTLIGLPLVLALVYGLHAPVLIAAFVVWVLLLCVRTGRKGGRR